MDRQVNPGVTDQQGACVGDERHLPERKAYHGRRGEKITGMIGWKREAVGAIDDVLEIGQGVAGSVTGHDFL